MDSLRNMFDYDFHFPVDKELTILQYIWIGGTGLDVRGKTMVTITFCIDHSTHSQ